MSFGALLTLNADGTFTYDPNAKFETLGVGETGIAYLVAMATMYFMALLVMTTSMAVMATTCYVVVLVAISLQVLKAKLKKKTDTPEFRI